MSSYYYDKFVLCSETLFFPQVQICQYTYISKMPICSSWFLVNYFEQNLSILNLLKLILNESYEFLSFD